MTINSIPVVLVFVGGVFGLVWFAFWVWSLVNCLTRRDETLNPMFGSVSPKLVWALIIFFTGVIGSIIYLFVAGTKKSPRLVAVQDRTAGTEETRRILDLLAGGKLSVAEGERLLAALETKEQQAATAQMRSFTPRAGVIGCLVLLLGPILLGLVVGMSWFLAGRTMAEKRSTAGVRVQVLEESRVRAFLEQQPPEASVSNGLPGAAEAGGAPQASASPASPAN